MILSHPHRLEGGALWAKSVQDSCSVQDDLTTCVCVCVCFAAHLPSLETREERRIVGFACGRWRRCRRRSQTHTLTHAHGRQHERVRFAPPPCT